MLIAVNECFETSPSAVPIGQMEVQNSRPDRALQQTRPRSETAPIIIATKAGAPRANQVVATVEKEIGDRMLRNTFQGSIK